MTDENEGVPSAPHATSMVVWDVPSPAAADTPATVKVGVQCAVGCCLSGQVVEVREHAGAVLGATILGAEAAPGTDALYWGDVTFVAPPTTGVAFLSAAFAPTNLEVPHLGAEVSFSLRVDAPPEYQVAVRVDHQDTSAPIERVEVRLDRLRRLHRRARRGTTPRTRRPLHMQHPQDRLSRRSCRDRRHRRPRGSHQGRKRGDAGGIGSATLSVGELSLELVVRVG